jgi:hypothetical protein
MCGTSSISVNPTGELHAGHGGKGVCLRSQISPELGQGVWSGRHMPETGTISPLRDGTRPDFLLDSCGGKIIFSIWNESRSLSLWNRASGLPQRGLKANK